MGLVSGVGAHIWKFRICFQNSFILFKFANFAHNMDHRKGAQIQGPIISKNPTGRLDSNPAPLDCKSDTLTTRSLPPGVSKIMQWVINPVTEENSIQIK